MALDDLLLRPDPDGVEAVRLFVVELASELGARPAPDVAWYIDTAGCVPLWTRYLAMPEVFRRAFRDGWGAFVAILPASARSYAVEMAPYLARPEGLGWLDQLMAAGPWLIDGVEGMTVTELRRRALGELRARRGHRCPASSSAASAESGAPEVATAPVVARGGGSLSRKEAAWLLADVGEKDRVGDPLTVGALRHRMRCPEGKAPEYAQLAALAASGGGRIPRAEGLAVIRRVADRNRASLEAMRGLRAEVIKVRRLEEEGLREGLD